MSKAACEAASLACIFASKVSSANAGVGRAEVARTHDPASASAMASRFMFTPNFTLDSCGENAPPPSRVPLGAVQQSNSGPSKHSEESDAMDAVMNRKLKIAAS